MIIRKFTTEYRENPLGLDCEKPRFSWVLESERESVEQTAYRIVVSGESGIVWDSRKTESDQSVLVPYAGANLEAEQRYEISLRVWNNYGDEAATQAFFETGLMRPAAMAASWITSGFPEETEACPVFRKCFSLQGKEVKKARLYATALGLYEAELNGQKVGEEYFAPGWTTYHKRLQYQTMDVTDLLRDENRLEITVADGWYCGPYSYMMTKNNYGSRAALLAELHVEYADGSREIIATDENWQVGQGQIRSSQIYAGENWDTTYEPEDFCPVQVIEEDKSNLVSQENEPVRVLERLPAKKVFRTPKGELVLDFGQNLSGVVEIRIKGEKGQKITLRHAETLDKEGCFYTENLRYASATDSYILNGTDQILQPHFTYHGFRYVCLEGLEKETEALDLEIFDLRAFTALAMGSDLERSGSFSCSDERVNQLWSNIVWSMRDNFFDIPTDCPQRDERLGWTGDAQVFAPTASYIGNTTLFFEKWLRDLKAEQTEEFGVPQIVPNILGDDSGMAVWGDAATLVPWTIYETYGDRKVLEDQYDSMKGWVDYITAHCEPDGLWLTGHQNGDWLGLDKEEGPGRVGATDRYLVANAFYFKSAGIVAKAAEILGRKEDSAHYAALAESIRKAFNEEYITATGRILTETQTACVLALNFGLAEEKFRDRIQKALLENIRQHASHLTTGFVGTPYLCQTLSDLGQHELAGKIFLQEDYPSWLYAVKKGATTIWERWNSIKPDGSFDESGMNSLNHYSYGSIGDWMVKKILGLTLTQPGYKTFRVQPQFFPGITRASGSYESVYGRIAIDWVCEQGKITLDLTVPVGTKAELHLPEKEEVLILGSGTYHYEYETATKLEKDRFTMDSTFAQLLEEPLTRQLLDQYAPGAMDGPLIELAMNLTLEQLCAAAPEAKPLYELILQQLNAHASGTC